MMVLKFHLVIEQQNQYFDNYFLRLRVFAVKIFCN
jgi:hypothetical protein